LKECAANPRYGHYYLFQLTKKGEALSLFHLQFTNHKGHSLDGSSRATQKTMKNIRSLILLALFVFSLVFPLLFTNPALTTIAVFSSIFAGAAVGWNVFSGYTGYISLGHAAFYGIGAYILTILCQMWNIPGGFYPFILLPVVVV